jgi:hypothetical protein
MISAGVETALLKAFLKICSHGDGVTPWIQSDTVTIFPMILATDGMAVKAGGQEDPATGKIVGLKQDIDLKFMADHPNPSPAFVRDMVFVEADQMWVGTLDGRVGMPIGTRFAGRIKSKEEKAATTIETARQLQCCLGCLTFGDIPTADGVITGSGETCTSECKGKPHFPLHNLNSSSIFPSVCRRRSSVRALCRVGTHELGSCPARLRFLHPTREALRPRLRPLLVR